MIKIYSQKLNDAFYQNLQLTSNDKWGVDLGDNVDIYKTHCLSKYDIYIFDSGKITNDIAQFISEYGDMSSKIYIYHHHTRLNTEAIKYIKRAKHLLPGKDCEKYAKYPNIIEIPQYLINTHVYYNSNIAKKNQTIYFLDYDQTIPQFVSELLYPNTKERILLFNNAKIQHPQNLGTLSEIDKAKLLNESKYFITNNFNEYVAEAVMCGCVVRNLSIVPNASEFMDYNTFLKEKIL